MPHLCGITYFLEIKIMDGLDYVDLFSDAMPPAREPIKAIGLPTLRGSGTCTKIGDTRYLIKTRNQDFPADLIGKSAMVVSTEGQSITVQIEQTTKEALVGQVIEFESTCNPKQWSGAAIDIYSMMRHEIYQPSQWLPHNFSTYRRGMAGIEQVQERIDPKGKSVSFMEYLDEHYLYWQSALSNSANVPEIGPNGQLIDEDEILKQATIWEEIHDAQEALKAVIAKHDIYRPIDDEQFISEIRQYYSIALRAAMGIGKNPAMDSMPFDNLMKLWTGFMEIINGDEGDATGSVIPDPKPSPTPALAEGKKKPRDGKGTSTKSDGLLNTSLESSEVEATPSTLVEG
jgi:hypothetical protein